MSVLELIDNALAGATTGDAMRWTPDPAKPTVQDVRLDMLWRKVWHLGHGPRARVRAWGWRLKWARRPDGDWVLVARVKTGCDNPDCLCRSDGAWLAVYDETRGWEGVTPIAD